MKLKNQNKLIYDKNDNFIFCGDCYCGNNDVRKLIEENKQLKQSQNQKAIEVLEKVKELVRDNSTASGCLFAEQTIDVEFFEELIDNQISELRGKDNG